VPSNLFLGNRHLETELVSSGTETVSFFIIRVLMCQVTNQKLTKGGHCMQVDIPWSVYP
jgi:hypothetical protein